MEMLRRGAEHPVPYALRPKREVMRAIANAFDGSAAEDTFVDDDNEEEE